MHHADLEFHLPQAGGDLAGQQSAADHDDRFLQARHLAQRERVARRSQINDVAESHARDGRTHRAGCPSRGRLC